MTSDSVPVPATEPAAGWRFRAPDHPSIVPVAAFADNYLWLVGLLDRSGARQALVVDPGDAAPILAALAEAAMPLYGILVTHHHADHTGGIAALKAAFPSARVVGPVDCRHPGIETRVRGGDTVRFEDLDFTARVIDVPGHTLDHVAYLCDRVGPDAADGHAQPVLFCGDTLFAAGCGRLFEGTPADMVASLARLAALPPQTAVYCAHEYTLANLAFAGAAEPGSIALRDRIDEARRLRAGGIPTVPTTIGVERDTNPFLRADAPGVAATVAERFGVTGDTTAVFAALRRWKNDFRG